MSSKQEYGDWSQVIYELQQRHPRLGNIPLTWYQGNPDGNCFFENQLMLF